MRSIALVCYIAAVLACSAADPDDDNFGGRLPLGASCEEEEDDDECVPGAVCDGGRCVALPACGAQCFDDEVRGLQTCDLGSYENRVAPPTGCFSTLRLDDREGCGDGDACPSGFDCVPTGYSEGGEGEADRMGCVQACSIDADCGPDMACLCGNTRSNVSVTLRVNECVPATCRSDDDCNGFACGVARSPCNKDVSFQCRTADDSCFLSEVGGQCSVCLFGGDHFEGLEYSNCD